MKSFNLIVIALFLFNGSIAYASNEKHSKAGKQPAVPVVVSKVVEMRIKDPVTFVGSVEPEQRSLVATEIGGLVQEMICKEGDFVKKGDIIAALKQDYLQIQLNEAKAAFKEGMARLGVCHKSID